ncbi:NAD(P)/FAD-dependent oxidoreductase [Salinarimonas rosea]|uniref:NAD(P)/FAD-dependent oxidoreductase n=1 Tax=Salinarimonas rosea TaxID=552063 RepID=UPI000423CBDD|nr:FAD-dependent oxidoreductase [Salinarimonas rosea]
MTEQGIPGVAVIGAGLAGVIAARDLAAAGRGVHIVEKSRGAGGRMATRRTRDGLAFDHGAQYVRAHGADFAAEIAAWAARGLAAPWGEGDRFVGVPAMNAPVKALASGMPLTVGTAVAAIEGVPGRWELALADGGRLGPFAAVLVTAPAPQAAALLAPVAPALAEAAATARYAPCLALMLAFAPEALAPPCVPAQRPDHASIAWIAEEATKPGRAAGAERRVVVHATPGWSRAHLEETPDAVARSLLAEAAPFLAARAAPLHAVAHRWRYALVEAPVGRACLWDAATGLGAAGDWCLGGRVEAAYDSGRALARAVLGEGGR